MSDALPAVERRVVSILFADLVGFTALSEGLDPEDVASIQDRYFADVRATIERYAGRLEKFIGDAAMAAFGVPRAADDDAERAVRAGLALVRSVEALGAALGLEADALQLRVGVNTGEVAYSPADGDQWRVSGDAVNTAARLQAAADPGTVLVGDGTALAVAESIVLDTPRDVTLKGKAGAVRAWPAITPLPHRSRERAMGALSAPLLGREKELAVVARAVAEAGPGTARALLLVAPPGAGKTRLLNEAASAAGGDSGVVVARIRITPEEQSPVSAVTQLLLSLAGAEAGRPDGGRLVADRLRASGTPRPEVGDEIDRILGGRVAATGSAPTAADATDEREARFQAWLEAAELLAAGRRELWVIEDVHWAGGDTLAFLFGAATRSATNGRLLLATARPSLLDRRDSLDEAGGAIEIAELTPLERADTGALIRALVGQALPAAVVDAVADRADGNPLFIEELLRTWISLGTLAQAGDGAWRLTSPVDTVALPQTVQQIYAAQLDDLPGPARTLLRRASIAGRHVARLSLDTLGVPDGDEALDIARRRALMSDGSDDPLAGPQVSFRHALLRDAGYSSLARAERARLHARLAAWYESRAGDRADEVAEQIARHYGAAVDNASRLSSHIDDGLDRARAHRLAIEWHERAAARAMAGAAHEAARSLLREALRHAAAEPAATRGRLLLALGEATAYTADMQAGAALLAEALEAYGRAAEEAATEADRRAAGTGRASAAAALARVRIQQVRFEEAGQLAEASLAELGDADERAAAPLLGIRSWVRATMALDESVVPDLERAVDIARRSGDRRLEAELIDWRASALGELGRPALADWTELERLGVAVGDWRRAVKAMRMQASVHADDEHEKVWPLADRAEEIGRRRGLEEDLCWIDYLRAEAGLVSGDWDRAVSAGRRVLELGQRNSYDRVVVRTIHVLLPIATARGDRAAARDPCRWHDERRGMFPDSPYARIMEAAIDAHCAAAGVGAPPVPDPAPRLASFEGEPGGGSWLAALETVIETWLAAGLLDAADDAVARMEAGARAEPATSSLGKASAAYLRAQVTVARGDTDAAQVHARNALAQARASRAPWWTVRALLLLHEVGRAGASEVAEMRSIAAALGLAGWEVSAG